MKVFVTGANGLLGSFVVKRLLDLNYIPVLLLRPQADLTLLKDSLSSCIQKEGDILDGLLLENYLHGCDVVIHCAGIVSFNPGRKKEIFEINVQGTSNIVNASLKQGIKKLIHISSVAALGRNELHSNYNEASKWEDSDYNSSYAKSKYLAELEVFRGGEEGLDFSIVNPSVIIGPGDSNKSSTRILKFLKHFNYFYPRGHINMVDVHDVAKATVAMININHRERLVLNAGQISYKKLFEIASRYYKKPSFALQIPVFVIRSAAFLDSIKRIFTGGEPFITKENLRFLGKNFTYTSLYYHQLFKEELVLPEESILNSFSEIEKKAQPL